MDFSSASWFSEREMEDPIFIHQCKTMDSFDEQLAAALGEDFQHSFSSESNSSSPNLIPARNSTTNLCALSMEASEAGVDRPTKKHKRNSYSYTTNNMSTQEDSSSASILSFDNSNLTEYFQQPHESLLGIINPEDEAVASRNLNSLADVLMSRGSFVNHDHEATNASQGTKRSSTATRPRSQSQDHIIAERKRREQLSQLFIALSAIVPGLKKMDKTSVLGEAIKYLKQLQERVKTLKEQNAKQTVESVVVVKKSQLLVDDETCSSDGNYTGGSDEPLPEIEARVSEKNVLLRIHCEKHKGVLLKTLDEIEKLNLTVVNTSVVPFGSLTLDITIVAQMENETCMTVKDLVSSLCSAVRSFV